MVARLPARAIALRDGFAVEAGAIADAGPYSPVPIAALLQQIETGEPLPDGTNAIVPVEAIRLRGQGAEAIASVPPGDGVLAVGGDATPEIPLRRDGDRLRDIDNAVLAAAGMTEVLVREPRVRIVCGSAARTPLIESWLALLARVVAASSAVTIGPEQETFADALQRNDADAVFVLGGTGSGRNDASVRILARHGSVAVHGIAVSPGQTAAVGFNKERPVLLIPGRLDATLAIWLLLGRRIVARLARGAILEMPRMLALKRKVTSTIGITEVVPVDCSDGMAEPLASGYLSLAALARSDGWIVVPAESEGFAAGMPVAVTPWP